MSTTTTTPPPPPPHPAGGEIRDTRLASALGERYLAYALSTIVSRSLPDVRDGLKPVHRRLLFAMRQLKLDPAGGFKKCARVVGDVIGKYHPHGDSAVYEAMVRLAQEFAVRYPLVEGQGNFGNIDGDNAAAMRYTEARLTAVAQALMEGLDENAVDFGPTYDGEEDEPRVMPAAFPNLLANGAQGIAVGMATNIPPHNAGEICDALLHLIDHKDAPITDLVARLPGPDFPTGGELVESPEAIVAAYRTGRGAFRLRARWTVEKLSHGLFRIVVTEIPYQVQKTKLIERIADLVMNRKVPLLGDVRDESAEDVRIVLEPRSRGVDPDTLMEQLFRQTELETRFNLNMNVLDADGVPRVMDLREVLQAFLDHRHEVLVRRTRHRLDKIAHRLEVLGGYLVAYLNLDEVIRIIREEDHPKAALIDTFKLTDVQAEAILNMRLRSLRKLEEMEIRKEHAALTEEQAALETLLSDPALRWARVGDEIRGIRDAFGAGTALGRRRTTLGAPPAAIDVPVEAMVEREPITVILSTMGWIRALKGHVEDLGDLKFKDGDALHTAVRAQTTDKLLLLASNGRFYTVAGDRVPRGRGFGEPVRLIVDVPNDADLIALRRHRPGGKLLLAASDGRGFVVEEADCLGQTKAGKQVLTVSAGAVAAVCRPLDPAGDGTPGDHVAVVGSHRKLLVFPLEQVPVMTKGRGVQLQRMKDARLTDVLVLRLADGLRWKSGDRTRTETDLSPWLGTRAQAGRLPPRGFPRDNRFGDQGAG
ncbi:DNA topoisomerase IV subunit A [Roseospira visakhapatnamensis]|uniref:DNA topoisomerase 4 subunit A n=1 Tax=Roseospira visakhapatnamensis TaxID=390880 RepID=A0A7W6RC98_9PROT|nr:DNA topoisomerase IV subunit A [Roseospira visakhapatnamensis]MBB4265501.1 topoisomerase-4 subunit A [Roseospira visakhapatnamensis]